MNPGQLEIPEGPAFVWAYRRQHPDCGPLAVRSRRNPVRSIEESAANAIRTPEIEAYLALHAKQSVARHHLSGRADRVVRRAAQPSQDPSPSTPSVWRTVRGGMVRCGAGDRYGNHTKGQSDFSTVEDASVIERAPDRDHLQNRLSQSRVFSLYVGEPSRFARQSPLFQARLNRPALAGTRCFAYSLAFRLLARIVLLDLAAFITRAPILMRSAHSYRVPFAQGEAH
jgi:hypothetical protein